MKTMDFLVAAAMTSCILGSAGTHLVAVNIPSLISDSMDGDIWTSIDAGANWINRSKGTPASGQHWVTAASDSTGTHLVAATWAAGSSPGGEVWTSADTGATWLKRTTVTSTAGFLLAPTVASDSTGNHLAVAAGDIWTSADAGATWIDQTAGTSAAAQNWVDMASDSTADHLVAVTADSDIWTSADAGKTWTNQTTGTAASGRSGALWRRIRPAPTSSPSPPTQVGRDLWWAGTFGPTNRRSCDLHGREHYAVAPAHPWRGLGAGYPAGRARG